MSSYIFEIGENEILKHLEKALDLSATRHKILANNIANVDTPNFKRSDVSFYSELKKLVEDTQSIKLSNTHPKHLPNLQPSNSNFLVIQDLSTSFRKDGNNVDIDREITELVKNSVFYNFFAELLRSRLKSLEYYIEEGRR